jgi:hypothetical protein
MDEELTPEQRQVLEQALLKAFSLQALKYMVRRRLGLQLEEELDLARGLKFIVADLVEEALRGGWLDQLMRGARQEVPGNIRLRRVTEDLKIVDPPPAPSPREAEDQLSRDVAELLEKTVRPRAPYVDLGDFMERLGRVGERICRIEFPEGTARGTGWLVGSDLLLTAYHVVEDFHLRHADPSDARCRFDFATDAFDGGTLGGTVCGLADDWLIASSPYAERDVRSSGAEPTATQLDYALIRLDRKIGELTTPAGSRRGWIAIAENPPVIMANDIMLIAQHPLGRSLKLAFGAVVGYNGVGTRLRYDANTDKGSSGSPCFDITLAPFGIHHAGGPGEKFVYNQCVPLRRVIAHMKSDQVAPFWTTTTSPSPIEE